MYIMPKALLNKCSQLGCTKVVFEFSGGEEIAEDLEVFTDVDSDELHDALLDWAIDVFEGSFDYMYEYSYSYTYDLAAMEIYEAGVEGVLASYKWCSEDEFCMEAE